MEVESRVRRSQSEWIAPSSPDKPAKTELMLPDKKVSVSQLIARYQTTPGGKTSSQSTLAENTVKLHRVVNEVTVEAKLAEKVGDGRKNKMDSLTRRSEELERSSVKGSLSRSKSMGSLNNNSGSIRALRALFESGDAADNKWRRSFSTANLASPSKVADVKSMTNGDGQSIRDKEQRVNKAPVKNNKIPGKEEKESEKMIIPTRRERSKTIGGIDIDKIGEENRRLTTSFLHNPSISVKAISALFMSKVEQKEPTQTPVKQAKVPSPQPEKKLSKTKMAEDTRQKTDADGLSHPSKLELSQEDKQTSHSHQVTSAQLSKDTLHQQRQKCELRRLLKHTNPELKMSDKEVSEELEEVLNTEAGTTAAESDYEGEVLSKRLIFENCGQTSAVSPCPNKIHGGQEMLERHHVCSTAAVFGKPEEKKRNVATQESNQASDAASWSDKEEEYDKLDLKKTRMFFESQSVESISRVSKSCIQKQEKAAHVNSKTVEPSGQQLGPQATDLKEDDDDMMMRNNNAPLISQTKSPFFLNNPFISQNVKECNNVQYGPDQIPEKDDGATNDSLMANVKGRAHLFESTPFGQIQHQNKDEIEMMVEIIKESLNRLHYAKVLHSKGSIIEVHETMIAKKADFTLSDSGPEITNDDVSEGNFQNFILHLLPRAKLAPQITYLKEDSKGNMLVTKLIVPIHHQNISTSQETGFKTASLVQLVEDVLCQDNSLRRGVLIQDGVNTSANVTVYSLYSYTNKEDVRSYCPLPDSNGSLTREINTSHQESTGTSEPEVTVKGNVKLFKSCIEKGDLEFLRTLQTGTAFEEEDISSTENSNQNKEILTKDPVDTTEENASEWAPVDVKRLKSMFTGDSKPTPERQTFKANSIKSTTHMYESRDTKVPTKDSAIFQIPLDDQIHQAELVQVLDDGEEIINLQTAIQNLQQATMEAKSLHTSLQLKTAQTTGRASVDFKQDGICEDLPVADTKQAAIASISTEHKGTHYESNITGESDSAERSGIFTSEEIVQDSHCESSNAPHNSLGIMDLPQHDEEPELQGKLKAALESLEKSNINVTRGDFKAAMIYHNSSRAVANKLHNVKKAAMTVDEICSDKSSENIQLKQVDVTPNNLQSQMELVITDNLTKSESLQKCRRSVGQKPAIPPKPARLTVKSTKKEDEDKTKEKCQAQKSLSELGNTRDQVAEAEKDQIFCESLSKIKVEKEQCETSNVSPKSFEASQEEEPVLEGKLRAALDSLEKSNINVTRGDFKAAMIYRNSSKAAADTLQTGCLATTADTDESSVKVGMNPDENADLQRKVKSVDKDVLSDSLKTSVCLKSNMACYNSEPSYTEKRDNDDILQMKGKKEENNSLKPPDTKEAPNKLDREIGCHGNEIARDSMQNLQECRSIIKAFECSNIVATLGDDSLETERDTLNENDESHLDFSQAFKKFECKKVCTVKNPPVKPKRVKIAQPESQECKVNSADNITNVLGNVSEERPETTLEPSSSAQGGKEKVNLESGIKKESKVELREKKGRTETESERRQRLSVHMDEIMRGNITAAMEIFDHLQEQEELQSILTRVEEIEQDTSEVDVGSLRSVFEDVPDWVVDSNKKTRKTEKVEGRKENNSISKETTETKSQMADIFGDLERASEDIMNLKQQTLARLVDIEEAIKKALYSVSTLKSDSDIAGLSCLLKESLGTVQGSSSSDNISKICIGSSKTKQTLPEESPTTQTSPSPTSDSGAKRRPSPPSSPAYISIQSAARKTKKGGLTPPDTSACPTCQQSPRTERKFRTTKTLECNSPVLIRKKDQIIGGKKISPLSPLNPKKEFSVLDVKTDLEGNHIFGTKTVTENYEMTDPCGNRFYTSKKSTTVTTQPETVTSSAPTMMTSPMNEVTTYPEFQPTCHETCAACLKPVYPMERISTDKYVFHKSCFCCKQCKKKLSVINFAPLYGDYYCVFHYKQVNRIKGNNTAA